MPCLSGGNGSGFGAGGSSLADAFERVQPRRHRIGVELESAAEQLREGARLVFGQV